MKSSASQISPIRMSDGADLDIGVAQFRKNLV